ASAGAAGMSAIDDLPPLREVIRRHDLRAKKSLGQNFLLDLNLTSRVARAAGPLEGVTVVEIGPGPGGLTRALLAGGARRVIAVERDERALAALAEVAARYPGRLEVVAGDALDIDPRSHLDCGPARIVANLPYTIATALLVAWLTTDPCPPWSNRPALMFRREFAERTPAPPGTKAYGRCLAPPGSSPPRAPRRFRSRASSRSPAHSPDYSSACSPRTNAERPVCRSRLRRSAARIAHTSTKARSMSLLMTT